jgi:hypothetical protein
MGAIDGQFVGVMLGRDTLSDAALSLDDGRTAIAGLPPDCGCEQVEDRAALPTALIGNDWSSPSVGRLIGGKQMAMRTL